MEPLVGDWVKVLESGLWILWGEMGLGWGVEGEGYWWGFEIRRDRWKGDEEEGVVYGLLSRIVARDVPYDITNTPHPLNQSTSFLLRPFPPPTLLQRQHSTFAFHLHPATPSAKRSRSKFHKRKELSFSPRENTPKSERRGLKGQRLWV